MFTAHVGHRTDDWKGVSGWLAIADGRSSILFAMVAGVSLAIVTGRRTPVSGPRLVQARTRLLVRSVLLLAVAGLLDLLGTPVYLILGYYAAFFVLALPFLRWTPRRLAITAGVVGVVGPVACQWGGEALLRSGLRPPMDGTGALGDFLLFGHYPALAWMAYVFAGMAIGRLDLSSPTLGWGLLAGGAGVASVFYGLSALITGRAGGRTAVDAAASTWSIRAGNPELTWGDPWPTLTYQWIAGPHTNTWAEVFGSGGFAAAILGLCLLLGRRIPRALAPIAATGAMALSVYCAQIVAIYVWGAAAVQQTTNWPLLVMVLITLACTTAWRAFLGRGPLERLLGMVATRSSTVRDNVAPEPAR